MALTYGFFNSVDGDRKYNAKQFGSIFDGVIHDGVYMNIGDRMMVEASGNGFQVNVKTGRAWFNHTWTLNDTKYALQLPNPEVLLNKYVAVIIEVNETVSIRRNSIKYVEGVPSNNPVYPTLTNTGTVHQYPLAYVLLRANSDQITQADIVNAVGTTACPFVTGVVSSMNIDGLIAQWQMEWNQYLTSTDTQWRNWFSGANNEWTALLNRVNTEWTTNLNSKNAAWDQNVSNKNTAWDRNVSEKNSAWDTNFNLKNAAWDQFVNESETEFETLMTDSESAFDAFMSASEDEYQEFIDEARADYQEFMTTSGQTFDDFMEDSDENFKQFLVAKNGEFNVALTDMREDFGSFWEEFKQGMEDYLIQQENIWTEWFRRIQGQLTEDAATNLQRQIDALAFAYVIQKRAVLGLTACVVQNKVIFGVWGTLQGERVVVGAPTITP